SARAAQAPPNTLERLSRRALATREYHVRCVPEAVGAPIKDTGCDEHLDFPGLELCQDFVAALLAVLSMQENSPTNMSEQLVSMVDAIHNDTRRRARAYKAGNEFMAVRVVHEGTVVHGHSLFRAG